MEMKGGGKERERERRRDVVGTDDAIKDNNNNDDILVSVEEREELSRIVKALAEEYRCEILSYCMYGSKVAGYARPDSDYDILLVLKDYKDIIKYVYVRNRLNASVLIVDGKALLRDAESAMLGEFVAGRLLHPYLPLLNGEYLKDVEIIYKKRVIMEECSALVALNPLIGTKEVAIPAEYFLFSKIKKRARIYPHALYSYVKTYTGTYTSRNMEISRDGFVRALRALEEEGLVELIPLLHEDEGRYYYHIILKGKGGENDRMVMVREMLRGAFAWLVHSYSARRSLNFFKEEARSKLNRRKEVKAYTIPPAFTNPSILLKASEGRVVDGDSWLDMIAKDLGFKDGYSTRFARIGDKHAAASLCILEQDGRKESIVIKYYTNLKMVKWVALNVWLAGIKHYDVAPEKRMMNEYIGVRRVRALGINTPEMLAVSFGKRLIAFKYVDGIPLSDMIRDVLVDDKEEAVVGGVGGGCTVDSGGEGSEEERREGGGGRGKGRGASNLLGYVKRYGSLLGRIHANGFILRDTKPSNVLILDGRSYRGNNHHHYYYHYHNYRYHPPHDDYMLYLTDFEQFSTSNNNYDDMGWDIACFLYYSLLFTSARKKEIVRMFVRAFLEGYSQHGSNDAMIRAAKGSYFLPFYPAMVIGMIKAVREEVRSFMR
ncbi:MAG: hypothetical protein QW383_00795 [Candidatus Nitrosocaldus sp.]